MSKNRRRRLFAQWDIQGNLCIRIAIYWFVCQVLTLGTIYFLATFVGTDTAVVVGYLMPALVVSSLMLPMILVDLIFFSNKFAGPILVLRRKLKELAETNESKAMLLRPGDYLTDTSDNFNTIREQLEQRCGCSCEQKKEVSVRVGPATQAAPATSNSTIVTQNEMLS